MTLSSNLAVRRAYDTGIYLDKAGNEWRKGMDGWFDDDYAGGIFLCRHHDMVAMIEKEHPGP